MRVPLGVVAIIYENRPNVTSDAAGLCLKSGNAAFLRGSSSALRSNVAIASVLREALAKHGLPEDAVILVEDTAYETATEVMQLTDYVDCLIPRGGPSLIQSIRDNATVPVIIDGDGNCHVYVDASADLDQALSIVVNAKTQRTSVCNARRVAGRARGRRRRVRAARRRRRCTTRASSSSATPDAQARSVAHRARDRRRLRDGVPRPEDERRGRSRSRRRDRRTSTGTAPGTPRRSSPAISTRRGGSRSEVDAAAVIVNASTRFTDGEEFGFGAEIGISTQKLHARGPMGLRELTTYKYVIWGDGQIRG